MKRTPQDYINEFIIWILNPLVVSKCNNELIIGNLNPPVVPRIRLIGWKFSKRLIFQLASSVTSDRCDSLAKTNFSLAIRRHLLRYKFSQTDKFSRPWFSQNRRQNFGSNAAEKKLSFKIPIHDSREQNTVFHLSSIRCKHRHRCCNYRRRSTTKFKVFASRPWEILTELRCELAAEKQMPIRDFSWTK